MFSPIVPAIIPQSYNDLEAQVARLVGVPEVHLDVVDGVFVDSLSWPYEPVGIPQRAQALLAPFSLEVDLMVEDQCGAGAAWLMAGADQLVFHAEVVSVSELEQFSTIHRCSIGIAASNEYPLEQLYQYFPFVDYVQVMGIAQIGAQGQSFDSRALTRIARIQADFPQLHISLDGSVNPETLPSLTKFHLQRLIVGSAIMGAPHPLKAYHELTNLVHSQQG